MGFGFDAAVRTMQRGLQLLLAPADSGSATSPAESNATTCQQGNISRAAKNMRQEPMLEKLPVDILYHIHSLLPVQDAARAACVSHGFLRSWRCYPNLTLSERTLGLAGKKIKGREIHLISIVDNILKNHSGLKTLKLDLLSYNNISASYLDRWLCSAFRSGVKELSFVVYSYREERYSFPCSVFSSEAAASSIQSLHLFGCAFHPTETIGHLRRLKIVHLSCVHITEGLEHFLSKSVALEQLEILQCRNIICLTIPCALQQLKFLKVAWCEVLQAVEINAPKLSSFYYLGTALLGISVVDSSRLKDVHLVYPSCILYYARARLPSIARNVKSLTLASCGENVNTPMLPSKLLRLKKLEIRLLGLVPAFSPQYDALSLVSFLEASPALDSFILRINQDVMSHDSVVGDDYVYMRKKPEFRHEHLRQVMITGFRASKSLVELVIYILESAPSLERLTVDTTHGCCRRSCTSRKTCRCSWMTKSNVEEAHVAVEVASRCITGRVPSGVKFEVLGPCSLAVAVTK